MDQLKNKNIRICLFFIKKVHIKFQGPKQIHVQDIRGLVSQIATKRGITLIIYDAVSPKVNQHFYIWSGYCISNINFIRETTYKILCPQHFIIDPYIQVVKGNNFVINESIKKPKNTRLLIFHIESAHTISGS